VSGLVEAARFNNRVEADLARLYLQSEGVEAILFDTEINYFYGGLFLPVRLMVLDEDLDLACRLLDDEAPS
jgi:putative signal transducing protein